MEVSQLTLKNTGKRESLYEHVYKTLKEQILKGVFPHGEKLNTSKIAKMLNVSRTPVREALRTLEMEGLVVSRLPHGLEVTDFNEESLDALFQCNSVLEGLAARLAAERIDEETLLELEECLYLAGKYHEEDQISKVFEKNTQFHDTIVKSSENPILIQLISQIRSLVLAYRSFESSHKFRPTFLEEHGNIFKAIKDRDPELAEKLMRKHILDDAKAIKFYKQSF
ncbi:GntR family transcriptional regulator [Aeribacillus sp. FSL K6-8394]|uniref:GntR family transcriptional regulator n=1 Tax=Aeribacillus sp. FSL K6-8394 TaxID=2954570 RepID=UPI0030F6DB1B